ncbi:MAG TPA: oligogalacturonate lyase family protein [Edaphobacter sp.]|uniref:oligogalacturonate lyase family protein n=1 Tax=Edaphobacter sp. TaxID=1934404 RepID=UPI002B74EF08|nr:oligogalacturonate lyase family protein [Edaphobacter sp.]HUZ96884.1 oligogalacturonate lyase family protein [Edaphobacter sp.]
MYRLARNLLAAFTLAAVITPLALAENLPTSWVDKDTGHRVFRLTNEPGSSGFYFNVNAYTPDGKEMVYNAPDGIHVFDLATRKSKLLVPNPPRSANADGVSAFRSGVHAIVVGKKTPSVFFSKFDAATKTSSVYSANVYTGAITKLVTLPPRANVVTVNADETLAAGTYIEGKGEDYGAHRMNPPGVKPGFLVQPQNKGQMMEERLAAHLPLVLFTINLQTGKMTTLLHSTDWVNHLLFSPSDPTLLMYCHEGPWQKVDRIWMIHTDGTHNTLIHKRTMAMEIAGHEFWGLDGQTIWYDWQYPKGEDFFLAGYNLQTHKRTAFHMQRNEWSIHFNLTKDLDLFTGDGGDPGQVAKAPDGEWIELFHPEMLKVTGINESDFWQPGVFHAEHLVNMSHHNYRLEPNVRFSPDKKMVIFTSNMFGDSYVFGVEVAKAVNPPASEIHSTPQLAKQFNPVDPTPLHTPPTAAK